MRKVDFPARSQALCWLAVLALALAVVLGLHHLTMPGLTGWFNDDGLYVDSARALAAGKGYVTTFGPTIKPAYRYPIMFPALLSLCCLGTHDVTTQILRMQWIGPLSAGALAIATFLCMRRIAAWPAWGAFAAAMIVCCQPMVVALRGDVMSDLPAALLSTVLVMRLDGALRESRPSLRRLVLLGIGLAVLCLMRYQAATLVVALALVLFRQRRFAPLLAIAGPFALGLLPWVLYRASTGGEEYYKTLGFLAQKPPEFLLHSFGAISAVLLSGTLPCLVLPFWPAGHVLALLLGGTLISALILLGTLAGALRPQDGETGLAPTYALVTLGLVAVWMVRYVTTADTATERLLLPVAPFLLLGFVRALSELQPRLENLGGLNVRRLLVVATAVVLFLTGGAFASTITDPLADAHRQETAAAYQQTFGFIREKLPADARLASLAAPMVYLHTGRACLSLDPAGADRELLAQLAGARCRYFVGLPDVVQAPPDAHARTHMVDASVLIVNDFSKRYPALLQPVYFNLGGKIAVFEINQTALGGALAEARARNL